jgi:hypothetical protein
MIWAVLALSRRVARIDERLMDLCQLTMTMQESQAQHAKTVSSLEAVAVALPDLDGFKRLLRNANGKQSELSSALSKVLAELESMRDTVETRLESLKSNQEKVQKVLKVWNSRLKEMDQTVATLPTLETEQANIKNELADWRSRFNTAYDVFAQFILVDGQATDQSPGVERRSGLDYPILTGDSPVTPLSDPTADMGPTFTVVEGTGNVQRGFRQKD